MSKNILFLAHVDESGKSLPRAAFEVLGAALDVAAQTDGVPTIGLIGEDVQDAADRLASTGARILSVSGPEFTHPRYSTDAALDYTRTAFAGIRTPNIDAQTIRPDAKLLFVAGAGWCKKQADGKNHVAEAEVAILSFLQNSGASLGGSKSLVDQSGENQAVLGFMTHLNQVGQTGSTPRHPKGLSTCCHGEEPHVVGWRFVNERRAINLDPDCGWARGKADVLYVADAFRVMDRLNALLAKK